MSFVTGELQMPSIVVEFSPTAMFETPSWQPISHHVLSGTTTAGRQHELNRVEASTLTLTLDNRGGQFSRYDTGGPFYFDGNGLVPGNPVRVIATWPTTSASVSYPIFYGYLTSCQVTTQDAIDVTATLMASDLFKPLAIQPMSNTTIYPDLVINGGAVAFWRFGDDYGEQTSSTATALESVHGYTATVYGLTIGEQEFDQPGPIYIDPSTALTLPEGATIICPTTAVNAAAYESWSLELTVDNITGNAGISMYSLSGVASVGGNFWIGPGNGNPNGSDSDGQVVYGGTAPYFPATSTTLVNDCFVVG